MEVKGGCKKEKEKWPGEKGAGLKGKVKLWQGAGSLPPDKPKERGRIRKWRNADRYQTYSPNAI